MESLLLYSPLVFFIEVGMISSGVELSVGSDIIEVQRIKDAVFRFGSKFLEKIFTRCELDYCRNIEQKYCSLAVRFAAKEAFSKALGIGVGIGSILNWRDISISNAASGKPEIVLSKMANDTMRAYGYKVAKVSLSHSKILAQAIVILMS